MATRVTEAVFATGARVCERKPARSATHLCHGPAMPKQAVRANSSKLERAACGLALVDTVSQLCLSFVALKPTNQAVDSLAIGNKQA